MITFITFVTSGLILAIILGHKHFELSTGKKTILSHAANYTNDHVVTGAKVVKKVNKENFARIVGWSVAYAIVLLQKLFVYIQNRSYSKKIVDIVSGKGVARNGHGASIFLKRIKDHDRVDTQ